MWKLIEAHTFTGKSMLVSPISLLWGFTEEADSGRAFHDTPACCAPMVLTILLPGFFEVVKIDSGAIL